MTGLVVPLADPEASDAARFGPKAASVGRLRRAGLPVPDGFCIDASAYRRQLAALGLEAAARGVMSAAGPEARRHALALRLGLLERAVAPAIAEAVLPCWRALTAAGTAGVVRSSALVEDRFGSSFAGQFDSYLDLTGQDEFLTALRACWAALWSTRALRYMAGHGIDPAETAMGVLVQHLVAARVSGGGLSRTATGEMALTATWGLGAAIAHLRTAAVME